MKKLLFLALVFALTMSLVSIGLLYAQVTMKPEAAPKIEQSVGSDAKVLPAAVWPDFRNANGDSDSCVAKLYSLSGKPRDNGSYWENVLVHNVNIDPKYRKTGRVLVTWNLRIIGSKASVPPVWPDLCSSWHGSVEEYFKGGNAYSQVIASDNYGKKVISPAITMTIPDAGVTVNTIESDPTHTGSFILKPKDFGGALPPMITLTLQWKNTTSMVLKSGKLMRSLIVTVTRD